LIVIARKLPVFRLPTLVWTAALAAAISFTGLEIRAVGQAQKPPQTTVPTAPPKTTAAPSQRAGGQGANQGAATQASQPGQGRSGVIGPNVPGQRGGPPWWQDEAIKKELALTAEQVRRLDGHFDRRAKELEPLNAELDKQRAELNRLMSDRSAGTAAIALQVARMEVPRAKINESFYVMMYRMSLVLDPDQNKKLQAIFDRNRDRGRGGESR
jgi:Spy/CpxP family protein refolding chaperone